ncbi:multidrug effflux MFS transporter [Aliamphritea ceti]|uniref:multidrug effflux MFS transporter n=1 Tax=Aliamphritea ceti TaxID=1524258 RepID=UPI0021C2C267|nr:multidrug effflux MFS transporter [Aliamphritea ceti]
MPNKSYTGQMPFAEFVTLMAMMMSLVALAIDAMLPALALMGDALQVADINDVQLVVSVLFLGMAVGQLCYGPASDSFGRRPVMYLGYALFIAGGILCIVAQDLHVMLLGRFLQGFGLAAPKILTVAIVRDQFSGRDMARVMSFIMVIFIVIPMIAPVFGQLILWVADWRYIFVAILVIGLISLVWFHLRQPETHPQERRAEFSFKAISKAFMTVTTDRFAMGYTVMAGIVSGAFVAYLSSSAQVFQQLYGLGELFPLYFALLAFAIGFSSYLNGRLVMRLGMQHLTWRALLILMISSTLCVVASSYWQGLPPLWLLTLYFILAFACIGMLFSNLNALAMEGLGQYAGMGAAVVGAVSTLLSAIIGVFIGGLFNGTVIPLVAGFAVCAAVGLVMMRWIEAGRAEVQTS